jgi:hypothetical protein
VEDALFTRLSTGPGLMALVGTRVYPVKAPQNVATPYVVYARVSGTRETAFNADPGMVRARYQFTPYSTDFDQMTAVRDEVRKLIERWRPGGVIDDVFIETDQDLWDDDAQLHFGPLDAFVLCREATS